MTAGATHRRSIDGLRAAAILSVLGFHAFPAWVPGGFIGVDVFFVISGFLITGILLDNLQKGHLNLAGFYARRIRRIFPALILVLASITVFGYFVLWPGEYRRLGRHIAGGAGFIVNFLLQQETGYFQNRTEVKPALHLWSLGVEEQFYIFWPLMLAAAWRCKRHAGLLIALVIAASFAVNLWLAGQDVVIDFYSPFSRFWELLAGGALAWADRHEAGVSSRRVQEIFAFVGLGLIASAAFLLNKDMAFPGWLAMLPVSGACLVIAAGEDAFLNRKLLAHPSAVGIGLMSYPLYLWHWPLLSFAHILSDESPSRLLRLAMVALSFALAALTYLFIEQPIRHKAPNRKIITPLLLLLVLIGFAGAGIYILDGVPARFADKTAQALDTDRLIDGWKRGARMNICHLQDVEADKPAPECIETARPLLLLWGDSHAASLYPGLKTLQAKRDFGIAQLTQAGCPPMFNIPKSLYRKNCNAINQRILGQVAMLQPAVVMLSSAWSHKDYPMDDGAIIENARNTIAQIRQAAPQTKIIVVGPIPRWKSSLPAIYRRSLSFQRQMPPARMTEHSDAGIPVLDSALRDAVTNMGVGYISLQNIMCDASGCLTRMGQTLDGIAYVDEEHITPEVANFIVGQFSPALLKALGKK